MSHKAIMKALAILIAVPGLWLCVDLGWKPIVGILLLMWGNNIMLIYDIETSTQERL